MGVEVADNTKNTSWQPQNGPVCCCCTLFAASVYHSVVWYLATRCLILGVGFRGQAIWWRHSRFWGYKGCCHGNHFWLSIYGVHIGAIWRIRLNCPCAAAMWPYVNLLWPLVITTTIALTILAGFWLLSESRQSCFQCFDTVGWVSGRASSL